MWLFIVLTMFAIAVMALAYGVGCTHAEIDHTIKEIDDSLDRIEAATKRLNEV